MTDTRHAILMNEVRYAERLCQRTARLYRRMQVAGTVGSVVAGSAVLGALSASVPPVVSLTGAALFALFAAVQVAVRPHERAAANEADMRRYAQLRTDGRSMDADALQLALDKARLTDAAEIEPLRDVAFNDVAQEVGATYAVTPLRWHQRMLAALA